MVVLDLIDVAGGWMLFAIRYVRDELFITPL
jgi:hypothetical protein